jgi:hypothetical protein
MRFRTYFAQDRYWGRLSLVLASLALLSLGIQQLWNLNSYDQVLNAVLTGLALMSYGASFYLPQTRLVSKEN